MTRLKSAILITLLGFAVAQPVLAEGDGCSLNAGTVNKKAELHQDSIQKYADKYGVSSDMVKAVIAVESCYNTQAVSPKGAQGLMQLIPATAERFGVANTFDSNQNIHGGTRYLSWLMDRYDGDLYRAIAAYNAGEGAVDKYKGIPPYLETQHYVRRVLTVYNRLSGQAVALPVVTASAPITTAGGVKISKPKVLPPSKPGRAGWQLNKAKAPQLYKH
ncbi:lytic transglycosylase domain-containing protein [Candidatus Thiothrix phosphatis]|uniref:lytic transglycosylase domain-containing protein n=1 Tax=Candidatus Thiothrix phosphatis TaxID=3112415 RepID=UPI002D7A05B3|nr:lytic transglycosylase domain-containing protein [Candidatus Thiothrix sp. Deng01]